MATVYAIIPAQDSPEKSQDVNLQEIKGEPLVGIAASQANNATEISEVVVNSNHEAVQEVARGHDVRVHERPEMFTRRDKLMEVDRLITWQVETLESDGHDIDVVVILYPTCPLRTIENIDETVRKVTEEGYDSALTLHEDNRYLWERENGSVKPTNYDPQKRGPESLEDWNQWVENKAVYAVDRDTLIKNGCRIGGDVGYVEMPKHRSISIDSPVDFKLTRFISEVDGASW